ncbi:MAG: hypothetical protein MUD01_16915, partial [Chloroflexaceae bacterium]|nr:hypothetical protein [Chloroflexaceae bacterium]
MLIQLTTIWNRLVYIQTTRPMDERRWLLRLWCMLYALLGLAGSGLVLEQFIAHLPQEFDLFRLDTLLRLLMVVFLAGFIAWRQPWQATSELTERLGQVITTLFLILSTMAMLLFLVDPAVYQQPLNVLPLWLSILMVYSQLYWLARRGLVRQSAAIFVGLLVSYLLTAAGVRSDMVQLSNPFIAVIAVLCAGLLLRWWAGLVFAAV